VNNIRNERLLLIPGFFSHVLILTDWQETKSQPHNNSQVARIR
jgi:hypothetical protein